MSIDAGSCDITDYIDYYAAVFLGMGEIQL